MGYLVSVVIPTKDRYKYLMHLVRSIKSFNSNQIEVVVQDNTDDNTEFVEFLDDIKFDNCHYYHETGFIPMSENADRAILHSSGEYICFLGDDDGVCPNVIEWAKYMKEKGIGALRSNLPSYLWPDATSSKKGQVSLHNLKGGETILYSNEELLDVIQRGFTDRGNLPSVYHGIVSRNVLNQIYNKCNSFFPGQSPDISNGVAVSLVLESYVLTNDIITVSGASKFHGGKMKGLNKKYPSISDMKWFRPGAEEIWDKRLPRMAEGVTIWAESTIETLRNMGREDIIDSFDFEKIYKNYVTLYYPMRKLAYPLSKNKLLPIYAVFSFCERAFRALKKRIYGKLGVELSKDIVKYNDVDNIEQCISLLSKDNA